MEETIFGGRHPVGHASAVAEAIVRHLLKLSQNDSDSTGGYLVVINQPSGKILYVLEIGDCQPAEFAKNAFDSISEKVKTGVPEIIEGRNGVSVLVLGFSTKGNEAIAIAILRFFRLFCDIDVEKRIIENSNPLIRHLEKACKNLLTEVFE